MSYSSSSHFSAADRAARHAPPRTQSAAAMSRHVHRSQRGGYTLTHAGHQIRIGPVAFWIVVGALVIMGAWSIATGSYFAFRDNVLTRLIGRQAQLQFAYEDRIAELRAQVDRITSRQLLDQEQFEQKLNALLQRQATLEQRSRSLGGEPAVTGSIKPARIAPTAPAATPRASQINDTVIFVAPPDREARLESREVRTASANVRDQVQGAGLSGTLARVASSLDKIEQRQDKVLTETEERIDSTTRRVRSVLDDLGVDVKSAPRGVGGPFVPLKPPQAGASNFDRQLYRINVARAQLDQYSQTLITVPVRKPVAGEIEIGRAHV